MKAEEAKKIAFVFNTSASNSEYSAIQKRIEEAAKKGKYAISLSSSPNRDVKKKLEEEGYVISSSHDPRDSYSETTLSWA